MVASASASEPALWRSLYGLWCRWLHNRYLRRLPALTGHRNAAGSVWSGQRDWGQTGLGPILVLDSSWSNKRSVSCRGNRLCLSALRAGSFGPWVPPPTIRSLQNPGCSCRTRGFPQLGPAAPELCASVRLGLGQHYGVGRTLLLLPAFPSLLSRPVTGSHWPRSQVPSLTPSEIFLPQNRRQQRLAHPQNLRARQWDFLQPLRR